MADIRERLQSGSSIPWIPDPEAARKYAESGKDSCSLNPLVGIAIDHYRRTNFNGDGEYDVVVLRVNDQGRDIEVAVHCQATVLANQMRQARPRGGEEVGVIYNGKKPSTRGQDYSDFRVVVDRVKEGEFDWAPAGDETNQTYYPPAQPAPPPVHQPPVSQQPQQRFDNDEIPF